MRVFTGCLTDRGNFREKNQDRAVCFKRKGSPLLAAACVCDGIGSFEKSEIASQMVADGFGRWFSGIEPLFPGRLGEEAVLEDLEMTIEELNELVWEYRKGSGTEIGCTMSALLLMNESYYVFHAGDSRICQLGDGLRQLTRDEVLMVEEGGRVKPLLANFVGRAETLWLNRLSGPLRPGDQFLVGSDGLFKRLDGREAASCAGRVGSDREAEKACRELVRFVLKRGERDNVSCILLCVR